MQFNTAGGVLPQTCQSVNFVKEQKTTLIEAMEQREHHYIVMEL